MSAQRAVFAGVARNCASHLPACLDNLGRLAALYSEAAFLFIVSDCTDETRSILDSWMARDARRGKVVDLGVLAPSVPLRTQRIALARNTYLTAIVQDDFSSYEHLVVADLDDVLGPPVAADIFAAAGGWLNELPERAAVFANALPRYYDLWALRHPTWCPYDCWHVVWGRVPGMSFERSKRCEISRRQIAVPVDLPPIRVFSAFGGLGIYKMTFALKARYCGLDFQGRQQAEHVAFNRQISQAGGELFIFPALCVQAPAEHLRGASSAIGRLFDNCQQLIAYTRPPWKTLLADGEEPPRW